MVLTSVDEKLEERGEDEKEGREEDSEDTLCFSFTADFFFFLVLFPCNFCFFISLSFSEFSFLRDE